MNIIGIDVSQGKSHATLITEDYEKKSFQFEHNKSGFNTLKNYIDQNTIIIFETTGNYSAPLTRFVEEENIKAYELNPLEANMRMSSLRRNKTDTNDSLKLALLGVTQFLEIQRSHHKQMNSNFDILHILSLRYRQLIKCRTRIINYLRASLELTFPELNQIFKVASEKLALQAFRMYCHPDFIVGLTINEMTKRLYKAVSNRIHKDTINYYCSKIWLAAKNSYPAVKADSVYIGIISDYCDEIETYNQKIKQVKKQLIQVATTSELFKIICSIPGTGQLNTALLLGFAGDIRRFDNYKQLNAFLGIDLNRQQSGKYQKADTINRRGTSQGRAVETEMIRSMLRNKNKIQNHLIGYYYKLKRPPYSKHDKVALIACANHLNRTIMYLVRTNQTYDYNSAVH